jgi:hypothetical protein
MAEAMQKAQAEISIPDNVRVVLFKIYERELVASLGELLTELNARMKNAGILPELGNPKPNDVEGVNPPAYQSATSGTAAQHSSQAQAQAAAGPAHRDRGRRRPRHLRCPVQPAAQLAPAARRAAFPGGQATAPDGSPRRPLALNEMLSVLSLLQPSVPQAVHEAMGNADASLSQLMKSRCCRAPAASAWRPSRSTWPPSTRTRSTWSACCSTCCSTSATSRRRRAR